MVKQKIVLTLFLLSLSLPVLSSVQATVDRNVLSENETLTLTFSLTGRTKGKPDLSLLEKDFDIVSRSQSSSYSFINGKVSNEEKIKVTLFPKHTGQLLIPKFKLGSDQTQAIRIKVNAAGATGSPSNAAPQNRKLWIEMKLDEDNVYVQQQMILTVRIYQAVSLLQASLNDPEADGLQLKKMGEDKNYQAVQNGRNLQITERKYAVFANKSGHFTINPVRLDGSIAVGGQSFFLQNSRPIRARSNAVEVEVKGIPAQWQQGEWLPARQLILKETWSSNHFKVGEPVTRTLTLQANGLMANQLPEIFPENLSIKGLKFYADTPELLNKEKDEHWLSQRREKIAVIPTKKGEVTLPEIKIHWWNINKQKIEVARIPEKTIHIGAGAMTAAAPSVGMVELDKAAVVSPTTVEKTNPFWKLIAIISTLGWVLTLLWVVFRKKKASPTKKTELPVSVNERKLKRAIIKACQQNNAKGCEKALLALAHTQWPEQQVTNLGSITSLVDNDLAEAISELDRNLYAVGEARQWQGEALLQAFKKARFDSIKHNETTERSSGLPPLYP